MSVQSSRKEQAATCAIGQGKQARSRQRAIPATKSILSADQKTFSVRVPFKLIQRGGRKLVITPDGAEPWTPHRQHPDNAMIKAIARAFRWRKLLETGLYASIEEMAAAEKINASYVSRVLRLTLLAPKIVEALLDGVQPVHLSVDALLQPFTMEWQLQKAKFGFTQRP